MLMLTTYFEFGSARGRKQLAGDLHVLCNDRFCGGSSPEEVGRKLRSRAKNQLKL